MPSPIFSIIIPVHDCVDTLIKTLNSIKKQTMRDYEIIIVDDNSCEKIKIPLFDNIRLIRNSTSIGAGASRNRGADIARGDYLIFIDADVSLDKSCYFERILKNLKDSNPDIITGLFSKKLFYKNFASIFKNLYLHFRFATIPEQSPSIDSCFFAIKKKSFNKISGFKTEPWLVEDFEFTLRCVKAKMRIFRDNSLQVTHIKKYGIFSVIRNDFIKSRAIGRISLSYTDIAFKHKSQKKSFTDYSLQWFINLILAPLLFLLPFLGILCPFYRLLIIWVILFLCFFAINIRLIFFYLKMTNPGIAALCLFFLIPDFSAASAGVFLSVLDHFIFRNYRIK